VEREWERVLAATEAKYLMLRHAFEELHWQRVRLRFSAATDWKNMLTPEAILSTGMFCDDVSEGPTIARNSCIGQDVHFSIVDLAWPRVKERIERLLHSRDF